MGKKHIRLIFLSLELALASMLLFRGEYGYAVCLYLILAYDMLAYLQNIENKKHMDMVLKSLKGYRYSQRGVNILVPKDAEITPLVYEINQLIDTNRGLMVEREKQESNTKKLLSNLSHDIRTPLTSIIGYADALKDGMVSSQEEAQSFIEILSMKSNNLKELTDQIFNIARIDADDVAMNTEYINLNDFLIHILIDFMPQIEKNQMTLDNQLGLKPFMINADPVALTRIFHNIIKNTLQHGKDGKIMGISSQEVDGFYQVIIWDRGKGIPKAKQGMIFERLFKVDDSRKLSSSNSGLGMAIAKKLVDKHQGRIYIKSEEHEFTEFYVEFPVLKEMP